MTTLKGLTMVAALLAGGASLAMAQNGPPTGSNQPPVGTSAAPNAPGPARRTLSAIRSTHIGYRFCKPLHPIPTHTSRSHLGLILIEHSLSLIPARPRNWHRVANNWVPSRCQDTRFKSA